ncbi:hypothetical protein QQZ08_009317 [Neonectria magnoliae]|uniref:Serine/threonine-protein kinase ppk6 n=1 Tax=Neonectria magnoliae TaxID=2732573 RepID=A0ABR1HQ69_9HYPO
MSADLFAEFNDLSDNPPRPPPATQPPPARAVPQQDPFDFFNTAGHASTATSQTAPPVQSWSAFQSQPVSTSSWGNVSASVAPAASSKPQVVAEDDDGWGDFEVAQPIAAASAPARPPAVAAAVNTSSSIAWHNPPQTVAPAPSKPSSIAWNSPAQTAPPVPSISPSIAWQNPAKSMVPPPSGSPSVAWQSPAPAPSTSQVTTAQEPPVRSRVVRASTLDLMSNSLVDTSGVPQHAANSSWGEPEPHVNQQFEQQPAHEIKSQSRMKPKLKAGPVDPNVLFDAEDFELQVPEGDEDEDDDDDDDEFGDFETVSLAPPPPPKPAPPKPAPVITSPLPPSMDLLSLDDSAPPPPQPTKAKSPPSQLLGTLAFGSTAVSYPQAPKSPSFQDRNPFPELAIKTPTGPAPKDEGPKSASPITAWPSLESTIKIKAEEYKDEDEGWGAWDDFPANDSKKTDVDSTKPPESWDWDAVDNVKPSKSTNPPKPSNLEINDNTPPPTNVPPPSVILSVFPELLNAGDALFKPMSGQNASIKQRIISEPKAVDFIEAYILLAMTAARVIAGRKQRWHRDKILAKSMSISAAGSKGMKLAGVDKTQSAREDREAADVAAVWRGQVGRLRSAVAAVKGTGKAPTLRVPEISETMHVQTARLVPTAPKACIICGLKREERVTKVDYEVEDSFGEWWADHWGHKACKNFWIQHEQMLRQR